MTSITQTIPNYVSGISQQPDQFKNPGQVSDALNVVPEIQTGLVKRPGSQFIKTLLVNDYVTWFHYYRDQTEQYLGQIRRTLNPNDSSYNPEVRMWNIQTGETKSVSKDASVTTQIYAYLRHSNVDDLQFLTINDYTYIVNRKKTVSMSTSTSTARPDTYAAYIELKNTSNARQYSLNLNSDGNTDTFDLKTATRLKHKSTYPSTAFTRFDGTSWNDKVATVNNSAAAEHKSPNITGRPFHSRQWHYDGNYYFTRNNATCPDIHTAVYSSEDSTGIPNVKIYKANGTEVTDGSKKNLRWRFTVKGRSHLHSGASDEPKGPDYVCTYDYDVDLLYGGEGWEVGDYVQFTADATGFSDNDDDGVLRVVYYIEIAEIELSKVKAKIAGSSGDGAIRPAPTAFDATQAVSSTSILGSLKQTLENKLGSVDDVTIIGNGLYLRSNNKFNVETSEHDLMNIMTDEINDVSKLPTQCKHGYIVKVANSDSNEDDYYMRFQGNNNFDGPGSWQECAEPGIEDEFDPSTMPLQLIRTASGQFELKQVAWPKRTIGDETTNSIPSFVGSTINNIVFWRNRLCFLSGTNVIASQPGDDNITLPSFWSKTALTLSPTDVIDISASSDNPAFLYEGMETVHGLLLFSENQQFLLTAEAEVLTPETAKLTAQSTYNYNIKTHPISLGTSVGFLDNAGTNSRFFEMVNIQRGLEPEILDQSVSVPNLLPKDIDLVTNSRENTYIFFSVTDSDEIYGYRYFNTGEKRVQSAWFKWKLHKSIKYHCIIDDTFFVVLSNNNLIKFDLRSESNTAYVNTFPVHLDNYALLDKSYFSYNSDTNKTTFTVTGFGFEPNKELAIINTNPGDNLGRYDIVTVSDSIATVPGDWDTDNEDLYIGYNFDMQIKLPTIYPTKSDGQSTHSDVNASLVLHRLKLSLGEAGVYETSIERIGKPTYTELIESSLQDAYVTNSTPWVEQRIHTLPVYERNKNLTIYLKSTHPSPTTLYSMSWEGDYNSKFYQRV